MEAGGTARTRTRTNTNPDGTEAKAAWKSVCACVARELKREGSWGVGGRAMRLILVGGAWASAGLEGTHMGWRDI
jgi:hypothetical protein